MGTSFRRAVPGDAPALVPLVEQLGYPSAPAAVRARLARVLERADHAVFVAEEGGALLGWIHVQAFESLSSEPCALIAGLAVDVEHRRRGVGRTLVAAAEDWARAHGLVTLRLRSRDSRAGAHAFYERLGFRAQKRQIQFRKELGAGGG